MRWVDAFHQAGLSVFLDWNATDFSEAYGPFLATEGCPNQLDWSRPHLRRFLLDCAQFWLGTYHLDGLQVAIDDPRFFFPGRDAQGFLSQLAEVCPAGGLFLRTPFPLGDSMGQAEQSAQPDPDAHGKKADTVTVYEGCMPIEIMAVRGADTMRFGPLRPVGLVDPNTGHRPWANVQLRAENKERTLYNIVGFQTNLKWGEQKRVFSMIPGLENAEFVRYGVMHRNTFLDAPRVLSAQLCLKEHPNVFFAGQITGFEGYMESAACGLLAARSIYARLEGRQLPPPPVDTMCGALIQYLTTENKHFQPMGANMGILPPLPAESRPRDKRLRYMAVAERAVASFQQWLNETAL